MLRVLAAGMILLAMSPADSDAQTAAGKPAQECSRFDEIPGALGEGDALKRNAAAWIDVCRRAIATEPHNKSLSSALARAFSADDRRAEALAIRRTLGRDGDADSLYDIYDTYKSFYRTVDGKPQLVRRDEAEAALRKAAELGSARAMWTLAVLLDRGSTVRRNPSEAISWAERTMRKPPKDVSPADIEIRLGQLLIRTNVRANRDKGLQVLEKYAAGRGRGDARAYLAQAIRRDNPVRARALLEAALRDSPGHVIPLLADMLLNGEGGARDEKRAIALLQGRPGSDVPAVRAALGRLMVEGRALPKNVQEGVNLMRQDAAVSQETRLEVMKLLAVHIEVRVERPQDFMYDALEAADLSEPGALAALIDLKMSSNVQLMDRGGACALIEKYAKVGREAAMAHSAACQ